MGGALLQKVNRDTQKFALKCSYAEVAGEIVNVQKSPTEMNEQGELVKSFKTSKAGRLKLIQAESGLKTVNEDEPGENILETVFESGKIKKLQTFEEIRERAAINNLILA